MEIVGGKKYVEIPGERTHELPPLLVRSTPEVTPLGQIVELAEGLIDAEEVLAEQSEAVTPGQEAETLSEQRRYDLAVHLSEQYLKMLAHWCWGDSILDWIRQCEITFGSQAVLRNLLRPDLWPHAGRSSFVVLLEDKSVPTGGVALENAVGLRLTFRQPPPISCFSDQFLFYLNSSMSATAYRTWACLMAGEQALLPPERFHFQVLHMAA